jgi:hypothetical protein
MGEEKQDDNASYALAMLNGTATEIVDWSSKDDRQKFLERRAKVAVG